MLEVQEATVRFGGLTALDHLTLSVADGEVVAVLGPSASGKTTLLRAVAGLQALDEGRVLWDGSDLATVPPHRRGFGLVFQDFALFPHLDVGRNVEFGLRMQGIEPEERRRRAAEALARVELAGMERRPVATLSGGQAQRVALARALVLRPKALLMDEPLSSLDVDLNRKLRDEILRLHEAFQFALLYVTHDRSEAFALAERVVLMKLGQTEMEGTPDQVRAFLEGEGGYLGHW